MDSSPTVDKKRESALETGIDRAISLVWGKEENSSQSSLDYPVVSHHTAEFLKSAALFMPGRYGIAATLALNAVDAVDPNETNARTIALDGSLGAAKGLTLRLSFLAADKLRLEAAGKGLLLGFSNRFADSAFNHDNFTNLMAGDSYGAACKIGSSIFDKTAAGADVLIFTGAHLISSKLVSPSLMKSSVAQNIVTGSTFGMSAGAYTEIQRQSLTGQFDLLKIGEQAALRGLTDGVAAIPGGFMSARIAARSRAEHTHNRLALDTELGGAVRDQNRPLVTTAPIATRVGEPIRIMAAAQEPAVIALVERFKDSNSRAKAIDEIALLPEAHRLTAIDAALRTGMAEDLRFSISEVPVEQLPGLVESIRSTPGAAAELLPLLPLYKLHSSEAPAKSIAHDTFSQLLKFPDSQLAEVRDLWRRLPGNPESGKSEVRDHLSQSLPTTDLARLMFAGEPSFDAALKLADSHPALIRDSAKSLPVTEAQQIAQVGAALTEWHRSGSLEKSVVAAMNSVTGAKELFTQPALPAVIESMFKQSSLSEQYKAADALRQIALASDGSIGSEHRLSVTLATAARLSFMHPDMIAERFWKPLQAELEGRSDRADWQAQVASETVVLEHQGALRAGTLRIPELRAPTIHLPAAEQAALRSSAETALTTGVGLETLWGSGPLGRRFPSVFGEHSEGGIVGRPQHPMHQFEVDGHTLHTLEKVRKHPDFGKLAEKDQVNLLWATMLHDTGKLAGQVHPGHEAMSARAAWGVLGSLGYAPERIQRIANIVSNHQRVSFDPHSAVSTRLVDSATLTDLASRYRHPASLLQTRILNEADIRSIDSDGSLWTAPVKTELDTVSDAVAQRVTELNRYPVPVLTTAVPQGFGLHIAMPGSRYFVHTSGELPSGRFLEKLSSVQSSENSASTSLIGPEQTRLYDPNSDFVAVMAAPPENISQAAGESLGTGFGVGWRGHVELTQKWADAGRGIPVATALELQLQQLGFGQPSRPFSALLEVNKQSSKYDNLQDLTAVEGPQSKLAQAQQVIASVLTPVADGREHTQYSELKVNNPTVTAIGIVRRGRHVAFEGMTDGTPPLFGGISKPEWLHPAYPVSDGNTLVIPKQLWMQSQRLGLPFLVF